MVIRPSQSDERSFPISMSIGGVCFERDVRKLKLQFLLNKNIIEMKKKKKFIVL